MTMSKRPLSPHLQIYRPQLTSVLSITHRMTGVFLSIGTLVLLFWLSAAARGPEAYAEAQSVLDMVIVKVALFGWTWAFFYHLCNGLRHLAWDAGYGFEIPKAYASGYTVLATSVVITLLVWGYVMAAPGGAA
jgi:succinate dehydrogenase / fumarate reductase cytochrome b subunit